MEALQIAEQELRRCLRSNETALRKAIRDIRRGLSIASTLESADAVAARLMVNEGLESVATARHELRLAVTAAGLEEGMSIGDLGRAWGISRQLASRLAREVRD